MSFDVGFQRAVLRLAQVDEAFAHRAMQLLDQAFFTTAPLGWCFTMMKRYYDAYGMRCTELVLRDSLRLHAPPEAIAGYAREIDEIVALGIVPEADYIRTQLAEFCKRNLFAIAHKSAASLWNENKHDEAYRMMSEAHEEMQRVSFEDEERSWFFEEFDERQKKRFRETLGIEAHIFTTGILPLDEVTDGGGRLGEVWLVLGEAKIGKTTWLCNQGFNALRVHKEPTLHIQLEGMLHETEAKYDSLFSAELHAKVRRGEFDGRILRELHAEYARLKGLLVIRALTDWDVNILHIEAEHRALMARGFRARCLVVDYVDLMRSRHTIRDGSETKHQIDASRDLKRFVMKNEMLGHTASQVQRPPKTAAEDAERVIRARDIADAYAKVRIFDFVGSLNATDEERERGEIRFFAEFHRSHPMNKMYTLYNDFSRMKLAKRVEVKAKRTPSAAEPPASSGTSTSMKVGKRSKRSF